MKKIEASVQAFVTEVYQATLGAGQVREIVLSDAAFDSLLSEQSMLGAPMLGAVPHESALRYMTVSGIPCEIRTLTGGRVHHALGLVMELLHEQWSRMRGIAKEPGNTALTEWEEAHDLAHELRRVITALSGKKPQPPKDWTCDACTGDAGKEPTSPRCTLLVGHDGFHTWAKVQKCQSCRRDTDNVNGWCSRLGCVKTRMTREKENDDGKA